MKTAATTQELQNWYVKMMIGGEKGAMGKSKKKREEERAVPAPARHEKGMCPVGM